MSKFCQNCHSVIPAGRLKILPSATTCVKCSEEEKWGAIHIVNHKTGNDVEVIKDSESAKKFAKLTARVGFGTLRGLRAGANAKSKNTAPGISKSLSASPEDFDKIGAKMLDVLDLLGEAKARKFVETQVSERAICGIQGSRLMKIIDTFTQKQQPEIKVKPKKKMDIYNPYGKSEPFESKDSFSKEIENSFKYWQR